ncbi:MAG: NFACT RNA binding domain-containing protein, partial [Thermoplasmata archaeon]
STRWAGETGVSEIELPRFSDAAVRYFATLVPSEAPRPPSAEEKERANLERQRERQLAAIATLEQEAAQLIAQGQAILTFFEVADRAVADALRSNEPPETLVLQLGEETVHVPTHQPLRTSAQGIFEEAKRRQSKLAGARSALESTDARLAQPMALRRPSLAADAPTAPRSEHWFERFRWFISSDRIIVVAGRDAASNDRVVRRHLRAGDLYLHADLHGAASVVVKSAGGPTATVPERTIEEAGRFAAAFSKAWRAGLASAPAFWVTFEQVSKTPATGEFVARGSWVVHGTKHFLRDLPLELALGVIRYEGAELWSVAPESAVRALGEVRFLLAPGEERERAEREVELARESGLSRSRLQGLLPAGGLTFRRP